MTQLQMANDLAVYQLKERGYNGDVFALKLKVVKKQQSITVPHSKESIPALAANASHGHRFTCTGGSHLTSDDMFKAMVVPERQRQIKAPESVKEIRVKLLRVEAAGQAVAADNIPIDELKVGQLEALLDWYKVDRKAMKKKDEKKAKWAEIRSQPPPLFERWTDDEGSNLVELRKMKIEMKDTALGRAEAMQKKDAHRAVGKMTPAELEELQATIDARKASQNGGPGEAAEGRDEAVGQGVAL